jgi:hypothetical protein
MRSYDSETGIKYDVHSVLRISRGDPLLHPQSCQDPSRSPAALLHPRLARSGNRLQLSRLLPVPVRTDTVAFPLVRVMDVDTDTEHRARGTMYPRRRAYFPGVLDKEGAQKAVNLRWFPQSHPPAQASGLDLNSDFHCVYSHLA